MLARIKNFSILKTIFVFFILRGCNVSGRIIFVNNSEGLAQALTKLTPGDTIKLADGIYSGSFFYDPKFDRFDLVPATIRGSSKAILENRINSDPVLTISNSHFWLELHGFTIRNAAKGISINESHVVVNEVTIEDIDKVGIEIENVYRNIYIKKCAIRNIGTKEERGIGVLVNQDNDEFVYAEDTFSKILSLKRTDTATIWIGYSIFGPRITGGAIQVQNFPSLKVYSNTFYGEGRIAELGGERGCWVDSETEDTQIVNNIGEGCNGDAFVVRSPSSSKQSDSLLFPKLFSGCSNTIERNSCYFQMKEDEKNEDQEGGFCIKVIGDCMSNIGKSNWMEGGHSLTNKHGIYEHIPKIKPKPKTQVDPIKDLVTNLMDTASLFGILKKPTTPAIKTSLSQVKFDPIQDFKDIMNFMNKTASFLEGLFIKPTTPTTTTKAIDSSTDIFEDIDISTTQASI